MKVKTLKNKINRSFHSDEGEILIEFDEARIHYTGYAKSIRTMKVSTVNVSKKRLTFKVIPSDVDVKNSRR